MRFGGIVKQSLIDYPGEIAAVFFTSGCNFRCGFCHNGHLLGIPSSHSYETQELQQVLDFLHDRRGFLDAVVISGGEPTVNADLPETIAAIKDIGYLVKLDTNGSNPDMLGILLDRGLLDYVAMDIKAPLEYRKYLQACGRINPQEFFNVLSSIKLLINADIKVEFRTTVVPVIHEAEGIIAIARHITGAKLFTLQQFNPEHTLDPALTKVKPYDELTLRKFAQDCGQYVQKVRVTNI